MSTTILFVYGTLKKKNSRNHVLREGKYLGTAETFEDYTLYNCGAFPAMVKAKEDVRTGVLGEVYEVPTSLLDGSLDHIEGRPFLYDREVVSLKDNDLVTSDGQKVTNATAYVFQQDYKRYPHLGREWRR